LKMERQFSLELLCAWLRLQISNARIVVRIIPEFKDI